MNERCIMIVVVTEWLDGNEHQTFLLDTTKFARTPGFEASYLSVVLSALRDPHKSINVKTDGTPLEERFGNYQDSMPQWERLKAGPPCRVDARIDLNLL